MATNDQTQPLTWNVPIVDGSGNPTPEFIRFIQSFRNSINNSVPPSRRINTGHGLTGGGDLSSDRTISLNADLSDLNDVDLSIAPTDGQALGFDAASGKWIAETVGGSIEVDKAGTPVTTGTTKLNFTGSGVTVTAGGTGIADIAIPITPPTVTDNSGWQSYTPIIAPQAGTITSYTATGQYIILDQFVFIQIIVSITNAGTGAGGLFCSVPFPEQSITSIGGKEVAISGVNLNMTLDPGNTYPFITKADGSSAIVTGYVLSMNGGYRTSATAVPVVSTVTGGSGGGSGGGGKVFNPPELIPTTSGGTISHNFYVSKPTIIDQDGTIVSIATHSQMVQSGVSLLPAVYTANADGSMGTLVAQGAVVAGVVAGINEYPLSSPLTVHVGDFLYLGFQILVTDYSPTANVVTNTAFFPASGTLPASNPTSVTYSTQPWATFWGIGTT